MKIFFLIDSLGSGGAQNQATLLAVDLKKRGHEVIVITYFEEDFFSYRLEEAQVPILFFKRINKTGLNVVWSLRALLRERKPDCVFSFMKTPNFYAVLASVLSGVKVKRLVSYRTKTDFNKIRKRILWLQKWVNLKADAVVFNSYHEKDRWLKVQPKLAEKFHTIYNGYHVPEAHELADLEEVKFLMVGRARPMKKIEVVLEALHLIKEKGLVPPSVHIYGSRIFDDEQLQKYVTSLDDMIDDYELNSYVSWFGETRKMLCKYPNYTALIHASIVEGLPNVVCESLLCGVPVIATNTLDHPVLIKDKERGYLFPSGESEALANRIIDVISISGKEQRKMSRNCWEYAKENLSISRLSESIENIIQE